MSEHDVVVVGAGPAGLASALALKDAGVRPLVVDRAGEVASSWRARYDRLRLNTWRPFSHLPGRRFPKGTPTFPSRDQLVEHLERHAKDEGVALRLSTEVERLERDDGGWVLRTSEGDLRARQVVVATGRENVPFVPDWHGREDFGGRLLHSHEYRNPEPFRDQRVLVVGPGCSGMEIAQDLSEHGAATVWLAVRTPPNLLLRRGPGGVPGDVIGVALWHTPTRFADAFVAFGRRMGMGDLTPYGLPAPEEGAMTRTRRLGIVPSIIDPDVVAAIKERRIEVVQAVEALDATGVRLADGRRVEPDAVICATGYRPGLEPLVGHLEVLDDRGLPRALAPAPAAPGLRFVGYVVRPAGLRYMAKEARRSARAIARELRAEATPAAQTAQTAGVA